LPQAFKHGNKLFWRNEWKKNNYNNFIFNIQQFYFYQSYADAISQLTNVEAGRFITLVLSYMFRDKEISDLPDDKVTSLFFLLFDDISQSKIAAQTIGRRSKHFAFHSTYANIFFALSEVEAAY
jgi:hypothetical protein